MATITEVDILIVGTGPAGVSTALHLLQMDQTWANRMLLVDKAVHPREKLCGGGVTLAGDRMLQQLGLTFAPDHIAVREVHFIYGDEAFVAYGAPAFRVIRRNEFDHWLVQTAIDRGAAVRQGEAVQAITPRENYVEVRTERATIHAQVVVAADGSKSLIRQKLSWPTGGQAAQANQRQTARLLEVLTAEEPKLPAIQNGVAVFDFTPLATGLQGYYWDFPSLIQAQPTMNRGLFDSRVRSQRPRAPLIPILTEALRRRQRDLTNYPVQGHPIHWFNAKAHFSQPRILLVGDAAGVDPLFGEGISFALGYGEVAATAIVDAFAQQDFRFRNYREWILRHPLLSQLVTRVRVANLVYRLTQPWQYFLLWQLVCLLCRIYIWTKPAGTLSKLAYRTKSAKLRA